MVTEDVTTQAERARLSEGMRVIFDQEVPSSGGTSHSRSGSQSSSSYSSHGTRASRGSRRSRRRRHRSPSSDSSSSSHSRSRSHPRCHRTSQHPGCRRTHHRNPDASRSNSRSPSPDRYRRSRYRSRSGGRRRSNGAGGRYRCQISPSPRRSPRVYRSRSRSPKRPVVQLTHEEKRELLDIAKVNASTRLVVETLQLPTSLRAAVQQEQKTSAPPSWERVKHTNTGLAKSPSPVEDGATDDEDSSRKSPKRKLITFSINNTVAKPSSSPAFHVTETRVTSRADSVGNRKPYGRWMPIKNTVSSSNTAKHLASSRH